MAAIVPVEVEVLLQAKHAAATAAVAVATAAPVDTAAAPAPAPALAPAAATATPIIDGPRATHLLVAAGVTMGIIRTATLFTILANIGAHYTEQTSCLQVYKPSQSGVYIYASLL